MKLSCHSPYCLNSPLYRYITPRYKWPNADKEWPKSIKKKKPKTIWDNKLKITVHIYITLLYVTLYITDQNATFLQNQQICLINLMHYCRIQWNMYGCQWHTPLSHTASRDAPDRKAERKNHTHTHTHRERNSEQRQCAYSQILTSSVSIWRRPACSPSRPSLCKQQLAAFDNVLGRCSPDTTPASG